MSGEDEASLLRKMLKEAQQENLRLKSLVDEERQAGAQLLLRVCVPLETLVASDAKKPISEISPDLRQSMKDAVSACREFASGVAGGRG